MLRWYQARLTARPLLTQAVTTAVLFGVGDVTAQQVVEKKGLDKHELARTGRMALYGGTVFGPAAATWFKFLQRNVNLKSTNATILARVALDQGVFAPTFIGIFLSSMALLEGTSPQEKLQKSYTSALTTNYYVWPAVQAVNFKLVPLEHRVLFVNIISNWLEFVPQLSEQCEVKKSILGGIGSRAVLGASCGQVFIGTCFAYLFRG